MNGPNNQSPRPRRRRGARALLAVAALALVLAGSLTALALASSSGSVVSSASSSHLGKIVVDSQGRTLYVLSPETTHHLLCKSSECLKFWPPLTASSSKTKLVASGGVHGSLGLLNRGKGVLQVTLNGEPLYRYAGDHAKGQANGQDIHSFGGVWHVISASGGAHKSSSPESSGGSSSSGW